MQQAEAAPAPPALPATPAAPAQGVAPPAPAPGITAAVGADGRVILEGLPQNAQEVHGLHARRDLLRDQLVRATNRREELVGQMERGMRDDARAGLQQRLTLLDQRILEIERDQATTEQLLSNASPELLAMTESTPSSQGGMVHDDEAVAWAFFAFGVGVVITMIIGRWRRRRARRDAGRTPVPVPGQDRRFDQLTQAVDAIAEEVERIGEGQRFVTQLLSERKQAALLSDEAGKH
ncbi:MAG TPA: hypothetical protein VMM17_04160 [Gemmatimonadaceae bacterium]|nr:hypothetical protein [Gemmatimonadaceae bacterium]